MHNTSSSSYQSICLIDMPIFSLHFSVKFMIITKGVRKQREGSHPNKYSHEL